MSSLMTSTLKYPLVWIQADTCPVLEHSSRTYRGVRYLYLKTSKNIYKDSKKYLTTSELTGTFRSTKFLTVSANAMYGAPAPPQKLAKSLKHAIGIDSSPGGRLPEEGLLPGTRPQPPGELLHQPLPPRLRPRLRGAAAGQRGRPAARGVRVRAAQL